MSKTLIGVSLVLLLAVSGAFGQEKKAPKQTRRASTNTFTGCIDQRGDNFVLTEDKEMRTIAVLHGEGFSDDNFAREMGHKVTVEGSLTNDSDPKVIRVTKVTRIADSCSPE